MNTYDDISARMEEGNVNRTIASTNMNATSSRAHTIVGIKFTQKSKNEAGKEMEKRALRSALPFTRQYLHSKD